MAISSPSSSDLQKQLDTLQGLVNVSLVLNSTQARDPLLRYIIDVAKDLADAEAASILLIDPHTQELVFAANSSNSNFDLQGKPVPLENSIAGTILKEGNPVAINDVRDDPRHYRGLDEELSFQTRSVLGVPMHIKDRLVGVLEVVNKREGAWTDADSETLLILASQAAVAVENSQLVEALRDAYAELDKMDRLKRDFMAIASHELRTPLGVILGYASFLKEESQGTASSHADVVLRSALQLRTIIEQMTNLTYMQQVAIDIEPQPVSVADLLHSAEQDVLAMAEGKSHELTIHPPQSDHIVRVDREMMVTALTNVLNNAVKFTPVGGQIDVETTTKDDEVWIVVRDTGIGIPEKHITHIFDEFYQVEDHMTRRYGGMGLGLSIAQALVQAQDGRIWAESAGENQGSQFTLCLPLAAAEA